MAVSSGAGFSLLAPLGNRLSGMTIGTPSRLLFHEHCAACHREDATCTIDGALPNIGTQHHSYPVERVRELTRDPQHESDAKPMSSATF